MKYIAILFSLSFLIPIASNAKVVKDFTAEYALYHNQLFVGESKRQLVNSNNTLTFSAITETAGLAALFIDIKINELSTLEFKNNQLNFMSYQYTEKNKDKKETYQLTLAKNQQFYNSHTKQHYPAAKNLQDTLGFTLAIMQDLQSGKRDIKYTIAEKDNLKSYYLKFIKKENIPTNDGHITTHKMEHYNPETKNRFTFWCADKMDFIPVKIRKINHKGDEDVFNLTMYKQQKIYLNLENEAYN